MEENNSGKFFVGSLAIVGVLVVVVYLVLNSMLSLADNALPPEKMDNTAISERIAPVAQERVGEEPVVQAAANTDAEAVNTSEDLGPGQQIFTAVCATCHVSGLLQAPRLGNKDDWAPRLANGMDTLYDHAINGFKNMPARGGRQDLSDDEVKQAVDYMVSQSE